MLEMQALQCEIASFYITPFMPKGTEIALPLPTKLFPEMILDVAMLFVPFWCTHPPPPFCWSRTYYPQRTLSEVTSWSWKSHDANRYYGPKDFYSTSNAARK